MMNDTMKRERLDPTTNITNYAGHPINLGDADLAALAKAQEKRERRAKVRHFQALSARWKIEPHFLKLNVWAIEQGIPPGTVHEWAEVWEGRMQDIINRDNKEQ